jgi:hypothetical protein
MVAAGQSERPGSDHGAFQFLETIPMPRIFDNIENRHPETADVIGVERDQAVSVSSEIDQLTEMAVCAMREAVAGVIEDHRRRGKPIVVWRDGKVVREFCDQDTDTML